MTFLDNRPRLKTWLLRGLVICAVLSVITWISGASLASSNQERLNAFMKEVGADSLVEFALDTDSDKIGPHDNGWYLYQGALSLLPTSIREAEDKDLTVAIIMERERALDDAHEAIVLAQSCRRVVPILNYEHPLDMILPHAALIRGHVETTLASARYNLDLLQADKAGERLVDALDMATRGHPEPLLVTFLVNVACEKMIHDFLVESADRLPPAVLERVRDRLGEVSLLERFRDSMRGEIYFAMTAYDRLSGDASILDQLGTDGTLPSFISWCPGFTLWLEYDKSCYLDLMLPIVDSERDLSTGPAALAGEEPSFPAVLTAMLLPAVDSCLEKAREATDTRNGMLERIDSLLAARR